MVTVALVLVGMVLAVAAGEFVRNQCRRMLSRPAYQSGAAAAAHSYSSPAFSGSFGAQEPAGEVASAA